MDGAPGDRTQTESSMKSKPKQKPREKRVCSLCGKSITGTSYTEWWAGGAHRMAHSDCFCAEDGVAERLTRMIQAG